MRKMRKKSLNLKKVKVASIEEMKAIKGKSGGSWTRTYPPDHCMQTLAGC